MQPIYIKKIVVLQKIGLVQFQEFILISRWNAQQWFNYKNGFIEEFLNSI